MVGFRDWSVKFVVPTACILLHFGCAFLIGFWALKSSDSSEKQGKL